MKTRGNLMNTIGPYLSMDDSQLERMVTANKAKRSLKSRIATTVGAFGLAASILFAGNTYAGNSQFLTRKEAAQQAKQKKQAKQESCKVIEPVDIYILEDGKRVMPYPDRTEWSWVTVTKKPGVRQVIEVVSPPGYDAKGHGKGCDFDFTISKRGKSWKQADKLFQQNKRPVPGKYTHMFERYAPIDGPGLYRIELLKETGKKPRASTVVWLKVKPPEKKEVKPEPTPVTEYRAPEPAPVAEPIKAPAPMPAPEKKAPEPVKAPAPVKKPAEKKEYTCNVHATLGGGHMSTRFKVKEDPDMEGPMGTAGLEAECNRFQAWATGQTARFPEVDMPDTDFPYTLDTTAWSAGVMGRHEILAGGAEVFGTKTRWNTNHAGLLTDLYPDWTGSFGYNGRAALFIPFGEDGYASKEGYVHFGYMIGHLNQKEGFRGLHGDTPTSLRGLTEKGWFADARIRDFLRVHYNNTTYDDSENGVQGKNQKITGEVSLPIHTDREVSVSPYAKVTWLRQTEAGPGAQTQSFESVAASVGIRAKFRIPGQGKK